MKGRSTNTTVLWWGHSIHLSSHWKSKNSCEIWGSSCRHCLNPVGLLHSGSLPRLFPEIVNLNVSSSVDYAWDESTLINNHRRKEISTNSRNQDHFCTHMFRWNHQNNEWWEGGCESTGMRKSIGKLATALMHRPLDSHTSVFLLRLILHVGIKLQELATSKKSALNHENKVILAHTHTNATKEPREI